MRVFWTAGFVLSTLCAPAQADWNYVKWGMTKEAAVAASKGEARPYRAGDLAQGDGCLFANRTPLAIIRNKTIGEFQFAVKFCGADGQNLVTSVVLFLDGKTPALKRALLSQYGKPVSIHSSFTIWNDKKSGNTVTFDDAELSGKVEYKASAAGL